MLYPFCKEHGFLKKKKIFFQKVAPLGFDPLFFTSLCYQHCISILKYQHMYRNKQ